MSYQLYVGNYPTEYGRDNLVSLFKDFEGVKLLKWFKRCQKSFCFLTCDDIEQVVSVIQKMNNAPVAGRKLIVRASDNNLQKYVELILQGNKCDPETIKEKESEKSNLETLDERESRKAKEYTKEILQNSCDSSPFGPMQVLRNRTETLNEKESRRVKENTKEMPQSSSYSPPFVPVQVLRNRTAEKAPKISCSDRWETSSSHSKSPSSHSNVSECSYNSPHQGISNNLFSCQDDDELSECVWLSVTNFPISTPVRWLYKLFDDYAPLKIFMLCNEPRYDKTLTEALVCFLNREVADDVIMNFDNTMFHGRLLLVNDIQDLTVMKELLNVVH